MDSKEAEAHIEYLQKRKLWLSQKFQFINYWVHILGFLWF
ncbi:hypothetical protein ADIARSV_0180 [Arcticibacter svalbardensis MN12-7]|uniref:Uncharacterized protein n=1 Tax=Arcticibacter svalbardensis MN12-7 TaxID=1150600 RepID=R9GYA3_9SPHI|nr:hypothetical protein ADIARSV_0180 [Arcticibacter svalbardensis MN12-7]